MMASPFNPNNAYFDELSKETKLDDLRSQLEAADNFEKTIAVHKKTPFDSPIKPQVLQQVDKFLKPEFEAADNDEKVMAIYKKIPAGSSLEPDVLKKVTAIFEKKNKQTSIPS